MIESIIDTTQVLSSNSSNLVFTDDLRTRTANCCGWLQHTDNSPLYKILEGGLYEITLNSTLTSATAGQVALGLYQDGILIPSAISIGDITTAGNVVNVNINKKLRVCCKSDTTLYIGSVPTIDAGVTGTTATATQIPIITNATFSIKRIS